MVLATALLCVSMLFLTLAELRQGASAWGLAPDTAQAEYLGAFNLYNVAQSIFGPVLLVAAVGWAGAWGWARARPRWPASSCPQRPPRPSTEPGLVPCPLVKPP